MYNDAEQGCCSVCLSVNSIDSSGGMSMGLALEGIRVIDLTQYQQGPFATLMLADMGAEVIKVEPRGTGDPGRRMGPFGLGGTSAYFEANNRNKKSIMVNVKTEKGKEIVYRLVERSDIFAQNFRPGVAERLGFGYQDLCKINPKIVYITGSAFGLKGPMGKRPGFDSVGQAMSGILSMVWAHEGIPPTSLACSISDQVGAFLLAFGTMVALFHRERTGVGQEVDVSLLGSTMALVGWTFQGHLTPKGVGKAFTVQGARIMHTGSDLFINSSHFTKDNKPLLLLLDKREQRLKCFKVLGLESFATDPRFETSEKIIENRELLLAAFSERIRTKDRDEWLRLFEEADIIAAPIHTLVEAADHPQVIANEYITQIDHPKEGRMRVLGFPVKLHKTPARLGTAPELGSHTEEVLSGLAGYTEEEIAQMKRLEII